MGGLRMCWKCGVVVVGINKKMKPKMNGFVRKKILVAEKIKLKS